MAQVHALRAEDAEALGPTAPSPYGQWLSGAFVELLDDGRRVKLWQPLLFLDRHGTLHTVEVGFISDGSSHPQLTWSYFGGPLSGKYRRAALVHDWLLDTGRDPDFAHKIFRDAMLADGLDEQTVDQFFAAVSVKTTWNRLPILGMAFRVLRRLWRW